MISQLHGTLVEATMSSAVVDVSGVGFELGISGSTAATLPTSGGEVRLYTRMQVREDAMTLFGFSSKDERTMFDRLVSVSGVGPRLALAVLSTYTVGQLYSLVMAEDDKGMAKVPGVGKNRPAPHLGAQEHLCQGQGLCAGRRDSRRSQCRCPPPLLRQSMTLARRFPWALARRRPRLP